MRVKNTILQNWNPKNTCIQGFLFGSTTIHLVPSAKICKNDGLDDAAHKTRPPGDEGEVLPIGLRRRGAPYRGRRASAAAAVLLRPHTGITRTYLVQASHYEPGFSGGYCSLRERGPTGPGPLRAQSPSVTMSPPSPRWRSANAHRILGFALLPSAAGATGPASRSPTL